VGNSCRDRIDDYRIRGRNFRVLVRIAYAMTDEPDFTDYPQSLSEARADRDGNAAKWSPRDALIATLRRIDSGEVKADALVIAYRSKPDPDGGTKTYFANASPDVHVTLGLLQAALIRIQGAGP
jgi:hypothetical protein